MTSHELTIRDKRVRVWIGGGGTPLLLLHSAWGDAELSWAPVWNDLSLSFTVIAPDLPGFGASEPLDAPTISAQVHVMKDLLETQKINRTIVVGNSFGAALSIEFASLYPEHTICFALVNGGFMPVLPEFIRSFASLPFIEGLFRSYVGQIMYSDQAFANAFPDQSNLPSGFIDRIRSRKTKQSQVVFETLLRHSEPQKRPGPPSFMVWGTKDRLLSVKRVEKIIKFLGNPEFIPLEGAGHMPQIEKPEEFVEVMKKLGENQKMKPTPYLF